MLFHAWYSLLYSCLLRLLKTFSFLNPKLKKGLALREKNQGTKVWLDHPQGTKPIWVHCASGELEYAKPVIRLIKQQQPEQKILVTYFSPSIEEALKKTSDIDFFCPTPWDTARDWREFIQHHQPKALLIARTDVWPMMVREAKRAKIPSLLFSKTTNRYKNGYAKWWSRQLLPQLSDIFCVSEDDRQLLFSEIRPFKNIHTAGDTRYDQCLYRLQHGNPVQPLNNFNRPIFVAGSTWSDDEDVLLPLIKNKISQVAFVIAPHEPTKGHLESLGHKLRSQGLDFQLYSQINDWNPSQVLIIDQVGILADLYKWGQFAFVGGSMKRSVHSVMEPLAQGLLTFVGPKHQNNREALSFKHYKIKEICAVQVIKNSSELVERFSQLSETWTEYCQLDLQMAIKKRTGASEIVLRWIDNHTLPPVISR